MVLISAFEQSSGSSFGSFGASSSPAFGTTMSSYGATSGPAFGGHHLLGTNRSNPAQTSSFGSMCQPSQPACGSNMFGTSLPFGGSQSAIGATAFPPSAVGTPPFGATSTPVFGSTMSPAFGDPRTQAFGSSFATPTSNAPGFSSSTPSFSFPSPHALSQSNSTYSCASSPPLQPFPSGAQATMPTSGKTGFWNLAFGSQHGGSRVATYTETLAPDSFGNGNRARVVKLMSISAMPVFTNKSHEELRHEDYLLGDKGGSTPAGGRGFGISTTQSGSLNPASVFAQTSPNPFIGSNSSSIFSPHTPFTPTGFGISPSPFSSSSPSLWPSSTANPFTPPSSSPSVFGQIYPSSLNNTPATSSFTFLAPSAVAHTGSAVGQASSSIWPTQTPFGQIHMFDTPYTGFNFSPSSPSPSVFGQMPSPCITQVTSSIPFSAPPSTYNSGLHDFTPPTPQTCGIIGQTSTLFGQSIFNTPFCGTGSGSSSAAIPTSNAICFSQAVFVDKESDKDMDMDDWVLC